MGKNNNKKSEMKKREIQNLQICQFLESFICGGKKLKEMMDG